MQDINIVYSSNRLRVLIFGSVCILAGIAVAIDSKGDFHACFAHQACEPLSIIALPSGFVLVVLGLMFFVMGVKGLPKLALTNDGITLSNMRGTRTVLWKDLGEFQPNITNRQIIVAPAIGFGLDGRKVAQKPIVIATRFYAGKTLGFENELNEYRRIALEESGPNPFDRLKSSNNVINQLRDPAKNEDLTFPTIIFRSAILFLFQWFVFLLASVLFLITFVAVRKLTGFNMKVSSGVHSFLYVLIPMYVGQYLATWKWRPNLPVMFVGAVAFISSVLGISTIVHLSGARIVIFLLDSICVPIGIFIGLHSRNAFGFRKPPGIDLSRAQSTRGEFEPSGKGGKSLAIMANVWSFLLILFVYFITSFAGLIVYEVVTGVVRKEVGVIWNVQGYSCTIMILFTSIFVGSSIANKRWGPNLSVMLLGGIIFIWSIVEIRHYVNPYNNDGKFSLFFDAVCIPLGVLIGTWLVRETPKIRTIRPTN
jgi:hypothetical protein